MEEDLFVTYESFRPALLAGKVSCRQAVDFFLRNIDNHNDRLNALSEVFSEEAHKRALELDETLKGGASPAPLTGMVLVVKDNIAYRGHTVSASSRMLEHFRAVYTATAVERLLDAGAIIIGRSNCDEFAMGGSNETSHFGPVRNAADESKVPGGSSGGSAVAVQAHFCMAALGSDTGGSVRQPASFTGTMGLRPTYGRISRYGLYAFASSMDQIGPIGHAATDLSLLMHYMSGQDHHDATSASQPPPPTQIPALQRKLSIAFLPEVMERDGLDSEIKAFHADLLRKFETQGHIVKAATFPFMDQVVPTYYVVANAEASSNLSRYAGMLYGYRTDAPASLNDAILRSRTEGFGPEVQRRIMLGTFVLSEGYYEAYYAKAQKVRRLIRDQLQAILKQYDFIIMPTTPSTAFPLGQHEQDPVAMYLEDIFTVQAALAGLPAISVPVGVHSDGLPFGVQVIGQAYHEEKLLAFARHLTHGQTLN